MKDIVISSRRQRRELWILAASFAVANILNIWAIRSYGAPLSEIYTSIFYVLVFTAALYAAVAALRLLGYGLWRLMRRPEKTAKKSKSIITE